jgi:AbrB family looped-hinge helix DNA binding protein
MARTTAKVTTKGQVTIPKKIREDLGLRTGDEIEFIRENGSYRVRKLIRDNPFTPWIGYAKHLKGMTTDELINEMRGEPLDHSD